MTRRTPDDIDEPAYDTGPRSIRYYFDRIIDLLKAYQRAVIVAIIMYGLYLWWTGQTLPGVEDIPVLVRIGIVAVPLGAIIVRLVYSYVKDKGWLGDELDTQIDVFEIDAARRTNPTAQPYMHVKHYGVGKDIWAERNVVDGDLYSPHNDRSYRVARQFEHDPETDDLRLEGPWMGEVNDVDLMTKQLAIEGTRGNLREWAAIGWTLYAKFETIASNVESAYWMARADEELEENTLHPEVVRSEIDTDIGHLTDSIETPGEYDVRDDLDDQLEEEGLDVPDEAPDHVDDAEGVSDE